MSINAIVRHALTFAAVALCALQADAQSVDPSAGSAVLPDWSGLWEIEFSPSLPGAPPQFTPDYARDLAEYRNSRAEGGAQDGPSANCVPPGMPAIMMQPFPIEFLFTRGKVTILIEAYSQWRQIYTDGRQHPDDPDPTFNGHSIGHWDGDMLVVDTVGFVTDTALGSPGMRHSREMSIIEKIRLVDDDSLEIDTEIRDPVALERPWVFTRRYARHADWTLKEYVCQQNNRNSTTADGKAVIDIEYRPGR